VAVALERAARAIGQVVDGKALGRRNPARERNRGHALTLPTADLLLDRIPPTGLWTVGRTLVTVVWRTTTEKHAGNSLD